MPNCTAGAAAVAAGLQERGLQHGQMVAIMLPTSLDFFYSFYGILLAGGVPVPLYPPARLSQIEDHLRRQASILDSARASILITVAEGQRLARLLGAQVEGLRSIVTVQELSSGGDGHVAPTLQPEDMAFLQYTSGSTGTPKGVILTHANLLANIRAMGQVAGTTSRETFVSWLPLYHDMGLIGACMGSLYYACPLVLMSPLAFLARPQRWLWAIHQHRGTISAAPNFAYELCLRRIDDLDIEGLDLSSWQMALNGAEPISPETVTRFCERFAKYGFRPQTMTPVYGLAESSLGAAFPPPGRGVRIDRIQRDPFTRSGQAIPADEDDSTALRFVSCGRPLPGHQIRIVDATGYEVAERQVGHLQFQGPSATSGYFRNPEDTRRLFDGDWLNSGDLAYIAGGDIYVTGRVKDLIIRAGRNIYPQEIEEAVGDLPGIRKGCVAAFGSTDPVSSTERLVVVAETRETDAKAQEHLRQQIDATIIDLLGTPADDVVLAPPQTVLKTSSGKVRRAACRERYEQGDIGRPQRAVWWQVTRLAWAGVLPRLRQAWRSVHRSAVCRLRLERARHRCRRVMDRRGALAHVVLAQSHAPEAYHSSCCGSLASRYASVGWSISPATKPVCWWSTMPAISIPWCWSQCCRARSALWPSASWLNSSLRAYCSGVSGPSLSNASTHSAASKTPIVCCRPSGKVVRCSFSQREPSGVRLGCGPFAWAPSWWRRRPACHWCRWASPAPAPSCAPGSGSHVEARFR